jgi:hypothetical protein
VFAHLQKAGRLIDQVTSESRRLIGTVLPQVLQLAQLWRELLTQQAPDRFRSPTSTQCVVERGVPVSVTLRPLPVAVPFGMCCVPSLALMAGPFPVAVPFGTCCVPSLALMAGPFPVAVPFGAGSFLVPSRLDTQTGEE